MINGERIRQARELRKRTQTQLAQAVGVTQAAIASIENGSKKASDGLAKAIALQTGFPVSFFERSTPTEFPLGSLLFRAHATATIKDRTEARRYGELVFELAQHLMERVEKPHLRLPQLIEEPRVAATVTRAQFGLAPDTPIANLTKMIEAAGVLVLALPIDLEDHDAFSLWLGEEKRLPIICVSQGRPGDRLRFSIAHELAHLVIHHTIRGQLANVEEQANQFAAELLMPEVAMRREIVPPVLLSSIARLKPRWRVAVQALVRRAYELEIVTKRQYHYLFEQIGARGWRTNEPEYLHITPEKPRALRQMAELLYGTPVQITKLAENLNLLPHVVKEILDVHAERMTSNASRPAVISQIRSVRKE